MRGSRSINFICYYRLSQSKTGYLRRLEGIQGCECLLNLNTCFLKLPSHYLINLFVIFFRKSWLRKRAYISTISLEFFKVLLRHINGGRLPLVFLNKDHIIAEFKSNSLSLRVSKYDPGNGHSGDV